MVIYFSISGRLLIDGSGEILTVVAIAHVAVLVVEYEIPLSGIWLKKSRIS